MGNHAAEWIECDRDRWIRGNEAWEAALAEVCQRLIVVPELKQ